MPIYKPEYDRVREAYITMAKKVRYHPAAPNDEWGQDF